MARLIFDFLGAPRNASATDSVSYMANTLKGPTYVGKPFLYFATGVIPTTPPATVDYDLHPSWAGHGNVATNDAAVNAQIIQAMLDNPPTDAITF